MRQDFSTKSRKERLPIFPLRITTDLILVSISEFIEGEKELRSLLDYFHQNSIKMALFLEGQCEENLRCISFVVERKELSKTKWQMDELLGNVRARAVLIEKPVALIRILGPHFDIQPGIAGRLYGALARNSIAVLAAATTITSALLVVHENELDEAVRTVHSVFTVPGSKQK